MKIIELRPKVEPVNSDDETLSRLVDMVNSTNLIALDKTLAACQLKVNFSYAAQHAFVGNIGEKIIRAVKEVGMCLPAKPGALIW